jgi:hypothetical protein
MVGVNNTNHTLVPFRKLLYTCSDIYGWSSNKLNLSQQPSYPALRTVIKVSPGSSSVSPALMFW